MLLMNSILASASVCPVKESARMPYAQLLYGRATKAAFLRRGRGETV